MANALVVYGVTEVVAKLVALQFKATDQRRVFGRVGATVEQDASSRAPRRTGRLAGDVRSAGALVDKSRATIQAGSTLPYAGVQEYGWPRRNIAAQPFLRPAADSRAEYTADLLTQEIRRQIAQVGLS